MSKNLKLEADTRGQIDQGAEQIFRGRDRDGEFVRLHIASAEWQSVLTAHSNRESALHALEMLSANADWTLDEGGEGWIVRLVLSKS